MDVRGLIALDKCPVVRPVGVGETLWRVVSKVICLVMRFDAEEVCGMTQLWAGTRAGIEGAIHDMNEPFEKKSTGWVRGVVSKCSECF